MLGIQLIPMGSYSTYLAGDADQIKANLAEATPGGYGAQFGEYMVQYLALADPAAPGGAGEPTGRDRQRDHQVLRHGVRVQPAEPSAS